MSIAMHSGSQPPLLEIRTDMPRACATFDLGERDVGHRVDLAAEQRVHLRGRAAKSMIVTWSKYGSPLRQ